MAFPIKQKILIALDGERDSEWAFDWYCNNLHRPGNNVIIVSCSEIGVKLATIAPAISNEDEMALEVFIEEENKVLAEKVSKYQKKLRSSMLVGKVLTSCHTSPSEVILNTAATEEVNMIIIGYKGCGLHRQGVGSVCNDLVSHSTIPVIVCRHPDAVNDGFVSKYVVDPKTMRLIPRRRSQSNSENIPTVESSTLNEASLSMHTTPKIEEEHASSVPNIDRQKKSRTREKMLPVTDTSEVLHVSDGAEDENAQDSHKNQEESDESISIKTATNDRKLLFGKAQIAEQPEYSLPNANVEHDSREITPTVTPVDKDNLQLLQDSGSNKVQNPVPKLSTKEVTNLLSTRLNKSSGISNLGKDQTNLQSSSKTIFSSNQKDSRPTGTNDVRHRDKKDLNSTVAHRKDNDSTGIMTTHLENKNIHKETGCEDNDLDDEEKNIPSAENSNSPPPKHQGHECKST